MRAVVGPGSRAHGGLRAVPLRIEETIAFRAASDPEATPSRMQATPAGAFRAARRMFLSGRRLDMQSLASELEISRATLYRWCGDRERLLSDVLWSLSHRLFEQAKADHPRHTGAKRVLAVFRQHVSEIVRAEPLQVFLQQETHAALRLLTSEGGGVQPRTVQTWPSCSARSRRPVAKAAGRRQQPRVRDRADHRGVHLPRHGRRGRA